MTPLPRAGSARHTPEQIAKAVVAKRPSPVGMPDRAELTVRLILPRPVLERLTVRAIREQCKLEAVIQEILGKAAGAE